MTLRILSPGPLTTVQDAGRRGWRHLGVAVCGALDPAAATLANLLVGNGADEAVLELTLHGPTLQFDHPLRLAICGARVGGRFDTIDGERFAVDSGRPVDLPAGTLRIGALRDGARAWLAFAGGLDVAPVLGSRSTDLRGGFGGLDGRALRAGDELSLRVPQTRVPARATMPKWWVDPHFDERGRPIRYVPATGCDGVRLDGRAWQVGNRSNRQGLRLEGAAFNGERAEEISAPVAPGTMQLPPDGHPIVLLADAQTVGGYPRLGHVVAADLPRLAQLRPGETVRFQSCDMQTATRLACAARARVARIALMIEQQLRGNRQ
jgi:antagonist of KipI